MGEAGEVGEEVSCVQRIGPQIDDIEGGWEGWAFKEMTRCVIGGKAVRTRGRRVGVNHGAVGIERPAEA